MELRGSTPSNRGGGYPQRGAQKGPQSAIPRQGWGGLPGCWGLCTWHSSPLQQLGPLAKGHHTKASGARPQAMPRHGGGSTGLCRGTNGPKGGACAPMGGGGPGTKQPVRALGSGQPQGLRACSNEQVRYLAKKFCGVLGDQ